MGQEGAPFGLQPGQDQRAVDLLVQRVERVAGNGPGEQHALRPLVEKADAMQAQLDRGSADRNERGGDILGAAAARLRR